MRGGVGPRLFRNTRNCVWSGTPLSPAWALLGGYEWRTTRPLYYQGIESRARAPPATTRGVTSIQTQTRNLTKRRQMVREKRDRMPRMTLMGMSVMTTSRESRPKSQGQKKGTSLGSAHGPTQFWRSSSTPVRTIPTVLTLLLCRFRAFPTSQHQQTRRRSQMAISTAEQNSRRPSAQRRRGAQTPRAESRGRAGQNKNTLRFPRHTRRSSGSRSGVWSDFPMLSHTARKSRSSTGARTTGRSSTQRAEPFVSPYRNRLEDSIPWTGKRSGRVLAS